ncbi:electron transfer flavoprotein subunit beta/FixA family protein [Myxococcota bacterium]|nr:electron transfer flavoprotein subunit beta/FixA family protein [Myxococcota bacterium]MBU1383018.1 electron transfer flavoprotein subunit beta/FixA family protein [Myxococcota bacterium]MBU1495783.1 electron transfer flavoprotein subunit beta/FixA family protein [Myxococcota bacterium]
MAFRILVLIKQVPDTRKVEMDQKTGNLRRDLMGAIMNPEDAHALACAIDLKEQFPGVYIGVLSMGPPQSEKVLKSACCHPVDEAFLLTDIAFAGSDTKVTAQTLRAGIKAIENEGSLFDLIICGHQAIDGDTAQTPGQLAYFLERPCALGLDFLEIKENRVFYRFSNNDEIITASIKLPALVSVTKNINTPDFPTVRGVIAMKTKVIRVFDRDKLNIPLDDCGLNSSPTRVIKTFFPEFSRKNILIDGSEVKCAETILKIIKELPIDA